MAPKRARTAAAAASASSSSPSAGSTKLTLHGGVPHHPSLAGLWREDRLTDFAICAEGVQFKAHRVALASSSKYFLNLFESGMRDAADATHALEGIRPKALEVLLAFIYEGKCQIDEGQLTEVLEASARLVVDDLKAACAGAIGARLAPSNALNVWRLADVFTLPALEKAAVEAALRGFEELHGCEGGGAGTGGPSGDEERGGRLPVGQAVVGGRRAARGRAACGAEARALRGDGGGVPARDRGCVAGAGL